MGVLYHIPSSNRICIFILQCDQLPSSPPVWGSEYSMGWDGKVSKLCHKFVLVSPLQTLNLIVTQSFCERMAIVAAITFGQQIRPELYQDHKHMPKYARRTQALFRTPRAPKRLIRLGDVFRYFVCLFPFIVFSILLRLGLPIDDAS
jgi:hypothetical protein